MIDISTATSTSQDAHVAEFHFTVPQVSARAARGRALPHHTTTGGTRRPEAPLA